jgi:type III restriction enzyme
MRWPDPAIKAAGMHEFEVPEPIICSPYEEPPFHWHLEEGADPVKRPGRRPAQYFYRPATAVATGEDGLPSGVPVELTLVNLVRGRLAQWRADGYPGATRTSLELLSYWRRDGRQHRLFFAQLEAAETVIGCGTWWSLTTHGNDRFVSCPTRPR